MKLEKTFRSELYLINRIPRKLLLSKRFILLFDIFKTFKTEFLANVPLKSEKKN
jgi:hypothetical protein